MLFPDNVDSLSAELLTEVLQPLQPGIVVSDFSVPALDQCGDGHASTADRIILEMQYAGEVPDDMPAQVMLKTMLVSPHAPAEMYENEVRFYRDIRPGLDLETPRVFASDYDRSSGQFGVIMEDLNTKSVRFPNATEQVSIDQVKGLLDTLATLHGSFWESDRFYNELNWLNTPVSGGMSNIFRQFGYDLVKDQVEKHAFKQKLIAPLNLNLEQMWERLRHFQDQTLNEPQTLLHGDTHVANTYYLPDNKGGLFDWQLMLKGNWAHDVCYIIVTALAVEDRRKHEKELLQYYLDQLQKTVTHAPDFDDAWQLYRRSIMWGLFIGWLITPPSNYGEAITIANTSKLVHACSDLNSFYE